MTPLIALTGATGFIGQHLLRELPKRGYRIRALLRRPTDLPIPAASAVIGDIVRPQNMAAALEGVAAVIHSAGIAHAMSGAPADDYRVLNTEATINLARSARRAGVRRFVFLSSIRAQSGPVANAVLTENDEAKPTNDYGRSKLAAEEGLAQLDLDWVALRPVLVYGPGVKGNMAGLLRLARLPYPLPLGGLNARRSLLSLDNLVAAIDCRPRRARAAAAAIRHRRPGGAHRPGDDRGAAPRPRARAGAVPGPDHAAARLLQRDRSRTGFRAARRLARGRFLRVGAARLVARGHDAGGAGAARERIIS